MKPWFNAISAKELLQKIASQAQTDLQTSYKFKANQLKSALYKMECHSTSCWNTLDEIENIILEYEKGNFTREQNLKIIKEFMWFVMTR